MIAAIALVLSLYISIAQTQSGSAFAGSGGANSGSGGVNSGSGGANSGSGGANSGNGGANSGSDLGNGCISAGFTSCCISNCFVPGGNCFCDQVCHAFRDCCDDIELICSASATSGSGSNSTEATSGSGSSSAGGNLFPFGENQGDTRAPRSDDGSQHVILSQPFPYFEENDVNLYVDTNGILSFQQPLGKFQSIRFPFDSPPLIAPFWDDVDITRFGNIFYRETNETSLLNVIGGFVQETFPAEGSFIPTYLFIATWDSVAQFQGGSQTNTFQVVLSTNGERSFVFFLYGDIEWGSAMIGFNAGDRIRFLMVPGSLSGEVTDIETTSNVGVPGMYIYRVDPPVVLPNGIRFDQEAYFVNESLSIEICAGLSEIMQFGGIVTFSTEEINATGNMDYLAITRDLQFDSTNNRSCVQISTFTDNTVEGTEAFLVHLTVGTIEIDSAMVVIVDEGPHPSNAMPSQNIAVPLVAGLTTGSVVVIIVLVLTVSLLILLCKRTARRNVIPKSSYFDITQLDTGVKNPYADWKQTNPLFEQTAMSTLQDNRIFKQLSAQMLIPCKNLQLLDSIGQGQFGIVYKAHLLSGQRRKAGAGRDTSVIGLVAVKTLKGFYDQAQVSEMLRESLKMVEFNHPNVLNLIGVCLDGGPAPYIVLPFMSNGSLLSYLRKERPNLLLGEEADEEEVCAVSKRLLDTCIQIAKGMEYLASKNFVHRDLAARNCMIDMNFVIKVADFGLSENTYAKTYFRNAQDASVKLPIKWLALESLNDGVFSEKTDVWAFGVTCWEVYSAGKGPYPGLDPMKLLGMLENGHRLEKPKNAACCGETYSIMLSCWNANPEERPPFSELVTRISGILEPLADYMDFTSFGKQTQSNTAEVIIENTSATAELEGEAAEASP